MALAEALRERYSVGELVHLPEDKRDRAPSGLVGKGEEAARDHRAACRLLSMAERLAISRQAVDRMRQRFENSDILKAERTKRGYFFRWLLDEPGLEKQEEPSQQSSDNPF